MRELTDDDRKQIAVGRAVPFSIYSGDRMLLLAAGRPVPNDFVREGLLRSGRFCSHPGEPDKPTVEVQTGSDAVAALLADYQHTHARAPVGFRMEREGQVGTSRVIGVSDDGHGLIMSWPTAEGMLSLVEGQAWTFRAFYAVAVVRFQATVEKVTRGSFSYFYVTQLREIDRRSVREWGRAPTCVWASHSGEPPRILVDLSVGGARLAVDERSHLQAGHAVLLNAWLPLAVGRKEVVVDATVLNHYGRVDTKHPTIDFFGVRFENVSDTNRLVLHAYVQQQLSLELDRVWHVLSLAH